MLESTESAVIDVIAQREIDEMEAAEIAAAEQKVDRVEKIPVALIERSKVALRDVDRQNEEYQLLVQSIRRVGVLQSILVREIKLPGTTQVKYGLVDGLQRYSAALDTGLEEIPARIVSMNEGELLEAQLITNLNRVTQRAADVSKHLVRLLAINPFMTKQELAERIYVSITYIDQRLSLIKLKDDIQKLVDNGRIHLTNAYVLAKLPKEEQSNWVEAAISDPPKTFVPAIKARVKEIRDAKRAGKDAKPAEFQPVQYLQKVGDVKAEYSALWEDVGTSKILTLLTNHNITDPIEAVKMAMAWILNFDPESQAEQARRDQVKKEKAKEKQAKLRQEREAKKQEEAAIAAADIVRF